MVIGALVYPFLDVNVSFFIGLDTIMALQFNSLFRIQKIRDNTPNHFSWTFCVHSLSAR